MHIIIVFDEYRDSVAKKY